MTAPIRNAWTFVDKLARFAVTLILGRRTHPFGT